MYNWKTKRAKLILSTVIGSIARHQVQFAFPPPLYPSRHAFVYYTMSQAPNAIANLEVIH